MTEWHEDRFKVNFLARIDVQDDGCWLWTGGVGSAGYGQVSVEGRSRMAHRVAYEAAKGPIPEGLTIDHLCRVKRCVNPDHLEAVTQAVNNLRSNNVSGVNARKTECVHGHPFDEANTIRRGNRRKCRECERALGRKYAARKRALLRRAS